MDLWNLLFDSEYKQRSDIESLKRMARQRQAMQQRDIQSAVDQQQRIAELENHVGELALLCRALLTILREDGTIQPERFQEVMQKIDAEDGHSDGMITPQGPPPDDPTTAPKINPWI